MKALIFAVSLILAQTALATTIEVWEGRGRLFDKEGKQIASYGLVVENTKTNETTLSHVAVTLPNGSVHKDECEITEIGNSKWSSSCAHGIGGGQCFGDDLCMSYEKNADGKAYATTIIKDGLKDLRMLRTELENGQPVRFFRETLTKR